MGRKAILKLLTCSFAAFVAAMLLSFAQAQEYPGRPITLIVPYPPGGGVDSMARIVAERPLRSARPAGHRR